MKEIVDMIYKLLNKKEIDWRQLEEYISSLGKEINAYDEEEDESILSLLYSSHSHTGSVNVRLTDLFIKHGFDVRANGGKNGESCLCALCWSSYDYYVLYIAELLFKAGARDRDADDDDDDESGVLSSIDWKFGYWNTGKYDSANMFVAYYILAERALAGKKYSGIRAFRDCVGKTVSKVERIKEKGVRGDKVRTSYLLHCEDMHLVASDCIEFIINPYAREESIEIEDVSDEYGDIIGAKIRGLRYFNSSLAKLSLDNGYAMQIGDLCSNEDEGAWFRVTLAKQGKLPPIGTTIESIKLWGHIRHSEKSTYYTEKTIVLNTEKGAYGLYAKGKGYIDATVGVETIDKELVADIERGIEVNNIVLKHVEYHGEGIKWMNFACDEGIIYIVSKEWREVAIFMSEFEIDSEKIRYIDFHTEGLKKIKPLS